MHLRLLIVTLAATLLPSFGWAQTDADLFNPGALHEIRIEMHPGDWSLLKRNFLEDTRYACEFHWIFGGKDIESPEVAVRSRGLGSRSGIKPSLEIEFNRYESNQSFLGLKNLVLRADTQDASMMHESVAMAFFRRMGLPASREAHAKLYVNGEYAGLYTIVEAVDKSFLKSRFGDDAGQLYDYQWIDAFFFEDRGPNPATYLPLLFQPEFASQTADASAIAGMVQAINQASDAQFQTIVSQYVDLKAFLTEIAAENFLAEQDGLLGDYGLNNFYLYRFSGTTRHTFAPWDKSNAFFGMDWPIMRNVQTNVLSRRALAVPELLTFYRAELARAADLAGGNGGWLEQEIRRQYQQIREAAYIDFFKLCDPGATGGLRPCSNQEFDAEAATMIAFAQRRAIDVRFQLGFRFTQQDFTINDSGIFTSIAAGSSSSLKVGYALIQAGTGNTTPTGMAILSLRQGAIVVSETTVPASHPASSGRIYAEVGGVINTGIAIANPNDEIAALSFYFTDSAGRDFGAGTMTIPARGQISQFLDSAPFNSGTLTGGTFTFVASIPVAAMALRSFTNERSELLLTTLPVTPIGLQSGNLIFPHFADGGGWTTQLILVNPSDRTLTGSLQFYSQGSQRQAGQLLVMATADGRSSNSFRYSVPPRGSFRLQTAGTSASAAVGSLRVVPAVNSGSPSGVTILSFRNAGITVAEAGVPQARVGSAFRLYAESAGDFANGRPATFQTGIAVSNSTGNPANINLELMALDGAPTGLTGAITIPPNGQSAVFLHQITGMAALPRLFQGILRISGPRGIAITGIRGRYNERGDFLIATIPAIAENEPASGAELVFAQIAEGDGYTTQFILLGSEAAASSGTLQYLGQTGQPLGLNVR